MRISRKERGDMEIDMYVLCLLRFKDDKVVFTKEELEKTGREIENFLRKEEFLSSMEKMEGWYVYNLHLGNSCMESSVIS